MKAITRTISTEELMEELQIKLRKLNIRKLCATHADEVEQFTSQMRSLSTFIDNLEHMGGLETATAEREIERR